MDVLRFSTAGSVDDGKSTLIGRLLFDADSVLDDQLAEVRRASRGGAPDLALLTDGLRAEREQGITIDVAYRYFATPRRKFIIADTPGHEQYTRNMATGASTADATVILVDATKGVSVQSRRHAHIAHLLAIPHLILAVNKMDAVGYDRAVFDKIRNEFDAFVRQMGGARSVQAIPLSALQGDNVVHRSKAMPWYQGPALLEYLEGLEIGDEPLDDLRFPVQLALRPDHRFRGLAGQIAAGTARVGMAVTVLPSGRTTRIKQIHTADGDLPSASAPLSVTLVFEDEVDAARGDMVVQSGHLPAVSRRFTADLVWMDERPLVAGRAYLIKHTTRTVRATFSVRHRIDVNTLEERNTTSLSLNEIGLVDITAVQPLMIDPYNRSRRTGAFIVIDAETDRTVAAGMVVDTGADARNIVGSNDLTGLWLVGGNSALRSETVSKLEERLTRTGHATFVLTGDELCSGINADLGETPVERTEATRRALEVVRTLGKAGVTTLIAAECLDTAAPERPWVRRVSLDGAASADEMVEKILRDL